MKMALLCQRLILALILLKSGALSAQSLPEGTGKAEFQRVCGQCHALSTATDMRLSENQWDGTVARMSDLGAKVTERDARLIVGYLAANFSADSPAAADSSVSAKTNRLETSSRPTTPLDVSLLDTNGCLACHRVQGKGGYTAPNLTDIGDYRTPEQIEAAILSPDEEVLPENRHVRVITKKGETFTGKLLNQDAFSMQLIDSKGQLRSFQKTSLRESTILVKGLMPSYKDKLTADQMGKLIRIVSSLKTAP
jgi:putative heme-binding domain-containing protein